MDSVFFCSKVTLAIVAGTLVGGTLVSPAKCDSALTLHVGDRLEPISKFFQEHGDAGKLHKPGEVGAVVLPANEEAPFPLEPGKEAFDEPPSFIAA